MPAMTRSFPPHAGPVSMSIANSEELEELVDVTILYGDGDESGRRKPTLRQMVSGQISMVTVRVLRVPIPAHLLGRDFRVDLAFRSELENWIRQLWERKDEQVTRISAGRKKSAVPGGTALVEGTAQ